MEATDRREPWAGLFERLEVARDLHARAKWSAAESDFRVLLADLQEHDPAQLDPLGRAQWAELMVRSFLGLSNPVHALAGSLGDALALCDRAAAVERRVPDPSMASLVLVQRGVLHSRAGQPRQALSNFTQALRGPGLAAHRDLATTLLNRGAVYSELGDFAEALSDYRAAHEHAAALGHAQYIAFALHNIGYARYTLGNLPGALESMERAVDAAPDQDDGIPELGRAEVLFESGLLEDAEQLLAIAAERLSRAALRLEHAEAEWFRARALMGLRRFDDARTQAAQARRRFERGGQRSMAALAQVLELDSLLSETLLSTETPSRAVARRRAREGRSVSAVGDAAGPTLGYHPGHAARLVAARWSVLAGDLDEARDTLAALPRGMAGAPLTMRVQHYTVQAELAFATDDRAKGLRAVRAGLGLLADHRSRLGSVESVTAAAAHGVDLTRVDVEAAVRTGRPAALFDALERGRATFAGTGRVTPPDDPEAAALLTEARGLLVRARELGAADAKERERLTRRASRIQDEVRERSWRHAGNAGAVQRPVTVRELRGVLAQSRRDVVVANFVAMDGVLRCVRVDADGVTTVDIGSADDVIEHVRRLNADFTMAANDLIPAPLRAAASASLARNLKALDAVLLAPLHADGDLYVVAREPLLSVPWAALPSRGGLRTSVNSYVARGRTHARPTGQRRLLAAAGPGVRHGTDEAHAVGRQWPGATVLTGKDAVTEEVRTALATHDVVHLATHGRHDADNPLFARIELADGPLFAHELDGTPLPGSVVVLSSCEVGGSSQVLGGELLGLTSVLLRLGARAVIASVAKLSDELAARVMPRLHAHLRETDDPEAALAAALRDVAEPVPLVCFSSVEGLTAG
ncbi:CHAT domain-containing protein [Promicromonospora sukumoe]|uniref:Tetratricopeptide (TPR) repeat protein n=1 Tax=Promicromonospora sukumoe TaxID=88382 RepID=A0A7W3PH70_9MICO|nr:CHAT domain-containing protein [Promicromonospora sukumoe]MBA8811422.1 tetratricopeptide (TPR) repeat protein [Promicromonospora sukumoe]